MAQDPAVRQQMAIKLANTMGPSPDMIPPEGGAGLEEMMRAGQGQGQPQMQPQQGAIPLKTLPPPQPTGGMPGAEAAYMKYIGG